MVTTLVLVPTLVRATQSFERGTASATIRLNRGFDGPVAKCKVTPPAADLAQPSTLESATPDAAQLAIWHAAPLPQSQHDASPQALRGPPLPSSNS
jgi:hypothetical protein